ncbi:hypothetical protein BCR43DRAFT_489024 [Syncephalastrum racemosum]|uniref:Uncharacterized protein n=1 Tax=Syncephalastrum racemosum TaxID=13706 RepID=A0A1X2HJL2_SYNRA|nr:hypothetical protein BCR43DRAFT_489024 [Syncephalastrum racemosum]
MRSVIIPLLLFSLASSVLGAAPPPPIVPSNPSDPQEYARDLSHMGVGTSKPAKRAPAMPRIPLMGGGMPNLAGMTKVVPDTGAGVLKPGFPQ